MKKKNVDKNKIRDKTKRLNRRNYKNVREKIQKKKKKLNDYR